VILTIAAPAATIVDLIIAVTVPTTAALAAPALSSASIGHGCCISLYLSIRSQLADCVVVHILEL
jgi:hypothetical protein